MRLLRSRTVHVALLVLGAIQVAKIAYLLAPPRVYEKDFRQDYALARSFLEGRPPYETLPVLFARYVGPDGTSLPSPSSHPPSAIPLFLPLAGVSYPVAAVLWTATCLFLFGMTVRTLVRELGWRPSAFDVAKVVALLLLWPPVILDLTLGQLTIPLLACIVAAWADVRAGRDARAGVWLGLGAALKLLPALLVVALLLRRRWRAGLTAVVTFAAFAAPVTLRFGPAIWSDYFGRVLPAVTAIYQDICLNLSLYGLLYRHLVGHDFMPPLFPAVPFGPVVLIAQLGVLSAAVALAWRAGDWTDRHTLDRAWSLLLVAMLLASPLTWHLSFVLLVLPLAVFARQYAGGQTVARPHRVIHGLVCCGLTVPFELTAAGTRTLAGGLGWHAGAPLPAASGLVLSLPTVALVGAFVVIAIALPSSVTERSTDVRSVEVPACSAALPVSVG